MQLLIVFQTTSSKMQNNLLKIKTQLSTQLQF